MHDPIDVEPRPAGQKSSWASFDALLEHASKRAGFPGFIIACAALVVSIIGLSYIVANYNLQKASSRPALAALNAQIGSGAKADISFDWNNIGRRILRAGTADLFVSTSGESWEKIGSAPLDNRATNIPGGMGAGTHFAADSDKVRDRIILVCAHYNDDDLEKYVQAFLFRARPEQPDHSVSLEEIAQPQDDVCRKGDESVHR
jgi:hypothetical protein